MLIRKKPSELTIVVVGQDSSVRDLFKSKGYNVRTIASLLKPEEYDGVVFTGGGDISPYLYGQGMHPSTRPDYARDLRELAVLRRIPRLKPKIGICRGGQLLNVYSGGDMYQDVDRHASGTHKATCLLTGDVFNVSSAHHQAMKPTPEATILMTAAVATKRSTYGGTTNLDHKDGEQDIEAFYYDFTRSYCFQGHPEYTSESAKYFFQHLEFCFSDVWSHNVADKEEHKPKEVKCG